MRTGRPREPVAPRVWPKVRESEDGCWLWTGTRTAGGYGKVSVNGRATPVHRWVYEEMVAPIPAGLDLDHLCRVRACVNPAHLEPVTRSVNISRGVTRRDWIQCIRGHAFDEANTVLRRDGRRDCRTCARERARRRSA